MEVTTNELREKAKTLESPGLPEEVQALAPLFLELCDRFDELDRESERLADAGVELPEFAAPVNRPR